MRKKGQVTLFVIIAILIVVAGILVYSFVLKPSSSEILGVDSVKSYISDCIDKSFEEVVYDVGLGGGYYIPLEESTVQGLTYYYDKGSFVFPLRERIQDEIEIGVENLVLFCVAKSNFDSSYEIEFGEIKAETKIFEKKVELSVDYPISIISKDERILLKDFSGYSLDVRLGEMHSNVIDLFNDEFYIGGSFCLSCLEEKGVDFDYEVEVYSENNDDIFILRDLLEEEEGAFKFAFAARP